MSLLLIVEHDQERLAPSTLAVITAAKQFSVPIHLIVMGHSCQKVAEEASCYEGVQKVWVVDNPALTTFLAEEMTETLLELAKRYEFILAPSSTFGKNLLPRLAALLDVAQISDVIAIVDNKTFVRPIYAGNAFATVLSTDAIQVMTIRQTAFDRAQKGSSQALIETYPFKKHVFPAPTFVSMTKSAHKRPELTSAAIIVAGGGDYRIKRILLSSKNWRINWELPLGLHEQPLMQALSLTIIKWGKRAKSSRLISILPLEFQVQFSILLA